MFKKKPHTTQNKHLPTHELGRVDVLGGELLQLLLQGSHNQKADKSFQLTLDRDKSFNWYIAQGRQSTQVAFFSLMLAFSLFLLVWPFVVALI